MPGKQAWVMVRTAAMGPSVGLMIIPAEISVLTALCGLGFYAHIAGCGCMTKRRQGVAEWG
ncbi:MAG: hypothetical protein HQM06_07515 [Magnetococcales bacterium]|nr:hypothetical protein [Magnetococcales bacterium]